MSLNKLDQAQIIKTVFDDVSEALKVKIQDTELAIELSAADGDSVTSQPVKLVASVTGVVSPADDATDIIPALDASNLSVVRVDVNGTGTANIYASPADSGSYFYLVGASGTTHTICARRIKVTSVNANGDVYLVGRS
jgi:hypothetical protein